MSKKIKIKSVKTYEDWEFCNLLIKDSFYPNSYYNPFKEHELKMIVYKNQIIGSLIIDKKELFTYCNYFNIRKDLRGQGLGRKSIKSIEKYLKFKNHKEMRFHSEKKLENLYKQSKFKKLDNSSEYILFYKKLNT